ncbi:MAG TPA: hypothetical protein VGN97_03415 [Mesorhizobium sp.]|nr:hypothetical protein [Mesorhizobium sp.]
MSRKLQKLGGVRRLMAALCLAAFGAAEAVAQECDPNYESSPCVPVASDVDCAGGRGNGPEYVRGPVIVIGDDVYDLDRDGDGVGCD